MIKLARLEDISDEVSTSLKNINKEELSPEDSENLKLLKYASKRLDEVAAWKSYAYIHRFIRRRKPKFLVFKDLDVLITDKQLLPLDKCLKNLKMDKKTFYDGLKDNPINLITYIRTKAETSVESLYLSMLDLQSKSKIGEFGQRLPDLFDAVTKKFPYPKEQLTKEEFELIDSKKDIIRLIFNNNKTSLIYESLNDITLYILSALEESIMADIKEVNLLKMQKETLKEDIKELEDKKKKILSEMPRGIIQPSTILPEVESEEEEEKIVEEKKTGEEKEEEEKEIEEDVNG